MRPAAVGRFTVARGRTGPSSRSARSIPGTSGAVASLLLNSVSLAAGEAMFVPVGTVHAYLSGLAVEVLAASDNELRGALTHKPVDPRGLLGALDDTVGAPLRIAPETFHRVTRVFGRRSRSSSSP